jgi:coiled-coil domain-containing protein 130
LAAQEKTIDQQTWAKSKTSRLTELTHASERLSGDPYVISAALRRRFREDKKIALEKQGRDDDLRERFGLDEEIDLGNEDTEGDRARWIAGRERKGLTVDEDDEAGGSSVRGQVGTPIIRRMGKGKAIEGTPNLALSLRKTTAKKYDPFAGALEAFGSPSSTGWSGMKMKGKMKDPGVLSVLASASERAGKEKIQPISAGLGGGLLSGYTSD